MKYWGVTAFVTFSDDQNNTQRVWACTNTHARLGNNTNVQCLSNRVRYKETHEVIWTQWRGDMFLIDMH